VVICGTGVGRGYRWQKQVENVKGIDFKLRGVVAGFKRRATEFSSKKARSRRGEMPKALCETICQTFPE